MFNFFSCKLYLNKLIVIFLILCLISFDVMFKLFTNKYLVYFYYLIS